MTRTPHLQPGARRQGIASYCQFSSPRTPAASRSALYAARDRLRPPAPLPLSSRAAPFVSGRRSVCQARAGAPMGENDSIAPMAAHGQAEPRAAQIFLWRGMVECAIISTSIFLTRARRRQRSSRNQQFPGEACSAHPRKSAKPNDTSTNEACQRPSLWRVPSAVSSPLQTGADGGRGTPL